MKVDAGLHW